MACSSRSPCPLGAAYARNSARSRSRSTVPLLLFAAAERTSLSIASSAATESSSSSRRKNFFGNLESERNYLNS